MYVYGLKRQTGVPQTGKNQRPNQSCKTHRRPLRSTSQLVSSDYCLSKEIFTCKPKIFGRGGEEEGNWGQATDKTNECITLLPEGNEIYSLFSWKRMTFLCTNNLVERVIYYMRVGVILQNILYVLRVWIIPVTVGHLLYYQ